MIVRKMAVTIQVVKSLVVLVKLVLIVFFIDELATFRHPGVSTVTPKVKLAVKFIHVMTFVTDQHAPEAEAMLFESVLYLKLTIFDFLKKLRLARFVKFLEGLCFRKKFRFV